MHVWHLLREKSPYVNDSIGLHTALFFSNIYWYIFGNTIWFLTVDHNWNAMFVKYFRVWT